AVRLDSGDLTQLAGQVRAQLDSLGATGTKIVVTSDLDEYAIAALAVAPVDSYGVGTRLVTGSGAPTAEMVYKLVAREGSSGELEPVAKTAGGAKSTRGGAKWAGRRLDQHGRAAEEIVATASRWLTGPGAGSPSLSEPGTGSLTWPKPGVQIMLEAGSPFWSTPGSQARLEAGGPTQTGADLRERLEPVSPLGAQAGPQVSPDGPDIRPLQVAYVQAGEIDPAWTGPAGLHRATERHKTSRAELPLHATRLSDGEPAIATVLIND
ncbi:MAG: hypothetical protein FWG16_04850, partial [Micrococcales bacterium]|nr:hypothetical protein [Micrococcales bacterium]